MIYMRLGIVSDWTKEGFERAAGKGLAFVELCAGADKDMDDFIALIPNILSYMSETGVTVGAIDRAGAEKVDGDGRIIEKELENTVKLIDACELLECPVVSVGCNYVEGVSLLKNVQNAARFFELIARYACEKGVKASVYNSGFNNFVHSDPVWELILGDIPELYISYDPSNAIYRGQDYLAQAAKWGGRFAHVRLSGSLNIGGKRFDSPPAGLDGTNWGAFVACLYRRGYQGGLSIGQSSEAWSGELGEWGADYAVDYFKRMVFPG